MEIQKISHENLVYKFLLTVDKKALDQKVTALLEEKAKTYKKPGFRTGKVPMKVLEKEYGEYFRSEAMQKEIQTGIDSIVKDNSITLIRQPRILKEEILENGKQQFEIIFEEMPQFDVQDVSEIKLRKIRAEITDTEVTNFIEKMQRLSGTFEEVDRKIQKGDFVSVSYTVKKNGIIINELENTEDRIDLTDPAFEHKLVSEKLIGKKKGAEISVKQEYKHLEGSDKNVDVHYVITKIEKCSAHALDEDFFKISGVKDLEQLREAIRGSLVSSSERMSFLYLKRQLLDSLSQQYTFDVPSTVVEEEEKIIRQKIESEKYEEFTDGITDEDIRTLSMRRIQLGLVIGRIATEHKINVPPQYIIDAMYNMAYKTDPLNVKKNVEKWLKNASMIRYFNTQLLEGVVIEHLIKKTVVEDIVIPVKEFYEEISEYLPDELYDLDSFEQDLEEDEEGDKDITAA
jgi:trigger factor